MLQQLLVRLRQLLLKLTQRRHLHIRPYFYPILAQIYQPLAHVQHAQTFVPPLPPPPPHSVHCREEIQVGFIQKNIQFLDSKYSSNKFTLICKDTVGVILTLFKQGHV